ncbi:MAG: hypothetical protein AB8G77_14575 [Rhodothermales bacterium]
MNRKQELPTIKEAEDALAAAHEVKIRSMKRGLYPRWYAVAIALWAGALCIAMESEIWLFIFVGGLIAHHFYKNEKGVWIKEIQSKRDLWITIAISLFAGFIYIAGYAGVSHYGLWWAPLVAGIVLFMLVFSTMELSYRSLRKVEVGEEEG